MKERKRNKMRVAILAALSVQTGLMSSAIFAQGALEEIIVTAQFREQNVQDTPIAITAMSSEMLEARSDYKLTDIASNAPNVTLSQNAGSFGPSINASIRGIGQYDFNPAVEPGVGIYIDDVYYGALTGAQFDLLDLDRVEILRGPQGTLAGKNSIGGAIKMYSKIADGENTGSISGTVGSNDRLDLRASADFSLTDNVAMRLSGVSKRNDGYIQRLDYGCLNPGSGIPADQFAGSGCGLGMEGDDDTSAMRAIFQIAASDSIDLTIIADASESNANSLGGVLISGSNTAPNAVLNGVTYDGQFNTGGTYKNYSSFLQPSGTWVGGPFDGAPLDQTHWDGRTHVDSKGISLKAVFNLTDNLNLESITAYREFYSYFSNDNDLSPIPVGLGQTSLDYEQKSQEFRLNGDLADSSINYTLGLYYFDQNTVYLGFQDLRYPGVPLQFAGESPDTPAETTAVFGTLSWDITTALTTNVGVRYTEEEKTYNYSRKSRDGSPHPILGGVDGKSGHYSGDKVDYRLNAQYRFNDDLMAYASYSTGFKGGGVAPRPFNEFQALPFNPEEVVAYEVGVKTDLLDGRLRLNAAYFYNDYQDIQLTLNNCNEVIGTTGVPLGDIGAGIPCALPQNAGDADIQGIELEAMYRLDNGLSIDAAISTLDFEYTTLNPALGTSIPANGITPYTPELKWSFGISQNFMTDWGTITPRLDVSYQDELFSNPSNSNASIIEDRTLVNAKVTWMNQDEDLELAFSVTNLTDEYYYQTTFDLTAGGAGSLQGTPGRPREWALSLRKSFF